MSRPRIALIVDQPQRDLAGLALTAFELCQQGAVCYLVPSEVRDREIWALAPDFVLFFSMRRGFAVFASQLMAAGIKVGVLDAEGGVWQDLDSYAELLWDEPSLFNGLSCVCCWGPRIADYVVSRGLCQPTQIAITGCPRFDFYSPVWRNVLGDESGQTQRDRILINTNWTEANPRFVSHEEIMKYYERAGWSGDRWRKWTATQHEALELTINLARDLARDYPTKTIVVRPHPFEGLQVYESRLGNLANIEVNGDGPVQSQIFKAAAVVQRSCTTAIEAGLASIPTFSPQWVPTPAVMAAAEAVSVSCSSYSELRGHLDNIVAGTYRTGEEVSCAIDGVVRDWFLRADGESHKRVSATILSKLSGTRVVDEERCSRNLYGSKSNASPIKVRAGQLLRRHLRLAPDWSFRHMGRPPGSGSVSTDQYYSVVDVERIIRRLEKAGSATSAGQPVKVSHGALFRQHVNSSVTLWCEA